MQKNSYLKLYYPLNQKKYGFPGLRKMGIHWATCQKFIYACKLCYWYDTYRQRCIIAASNL